MLRFPRGTLLMIFILILNIQSGSTQICTDVCSGEYTNCLDSQGFWICSTQSDSCCCMCTSSSSTIISVLARTLTLIGLIGTFFLIVAFLRVKDLRQSPGDIIFMIAASDFLQCVCFLYLEDSSILPKFETNPEACTNASIVYNFTKYIRNTYNIMFYIYYMNSLRSSLKSSNIPDFMYHLVAIGITFVFMYIDSVQGAFGESIFGICTLRTSNHWVFQTGLLVLYFIIPAFTLYYTHRYAPKGEKYFAATKEFLDYYRLFVIASALIILFVAVFDLVQIIYMPQYYDYLTDINYNTEDTVVNILHSFSSLVKTFNPVVLAIVRLFDPTLKKYRHKIFCFIKEEDEDLGEVQLRSRAVSLDAASVERKLNKSTLIDQVQHSLKVQAIYSILSSLHFYCVTTLKEKMDRRDQENDPYYIRESRVKVNFNISEELLKKELPDLHGEISSRRYKVIDGTLTVYAPKIFEEVIDLDGKAAEIATSLDLKSNFNRILKAGIGTSGKSGEFFFFSSDNKLIIKTITQSEVTIMLKILPNYCQHFRGNPFSLIAKIYGIFTFERKMPFERYHLVLMRNINGYPSNCIERKYDLKGSTVGRYTLKANEDVPLDLLKYKDTLKDLDFNKYEKKLNLDNEDKGHLFEILKRDCQFLRYHNLIDYSLAVYIINKDTLQTLLDEDSKRRSSSFNDSGDLDSILKELRRKERQTSLSSSMIKELIQQHNLEYESNIRAVNPYVSMKSTKEPFYYQMGIIDYLTEYTCRKSLEKISKKLAACNPKLDTSVQTAHDYAERFVKYTESILFQLTHLFRSYIPIL